MLISGFVNVLAAPRISDVVVTGVHTSEQPGSSTNA